METDGEIYYYLIGCSSSISIIGSLLLILIICFNKLIEASTSRLIIFISVVDILRSSLFLLQIFIYVPVVCSGFGYLLNITLGINVFWAAYISYSVLKIFEQKQEPYKHIDHLFFIYSVTIVPAYSALPFLTNSFGKSYYFCTLKTDYDGEVWRLILVYIPEWAFLIYTCIIFSKVHIMMRKDNNSNIKSIIANRGAIYPIIIFISIIPMTIIRICEYLDEPIKYSSIISAFLLSSRGLFNLIGTLINKNIRYAIRRRLRSTFHSFRSTESIISNLFINGDQNVETLTINN